MNKLPPLRGTPKQIKWAETIRQRTFSNKEDYGMAVLIQAEKVDDASWWIANKTSGNKLVTVPKDPAPNQMVGGPVPSAEYLEGMTPLTGAPLVGDVNKRVQRLLGEPEEPNDEPHPAEEFADHVAHFPELAALAVMASLSRLYRGKVQQVLRSRVELRLEGVRSHLLAAIDKDIDGIRKILGS